jgi:hypothetical protein
MLWFMKILASPSVKLPVLRNTSRCAVEEEEELPPLLQHQHLLLLPILLLLTLPLHLHLLPPLMDLRLVLVVWLIPETLMLWFMKILASPSVMLPVLKNTSRCAVEEVELQHQLLLPQLLLRQLHLPPQLLLPLLPASLMPLQEAPTENTTDKFGIWPPRRMSTTPGTQTHPALPKTSTPLKPLRETALMPLDTTLVRDDTRTPSAPMSTLPRCKKNVKSLMKFVPTPSPEMLRDALGAETNNLFNCIT